MPGEPKPYFQNPIDTLTHRKHAGSLAASALISGYLVPFVAFQLNRAQNVALVTYCGNRRVRQCGIK